MKFRISDLPGLESPGLELSLILNLDGSVNINQDSFAGETPFFSQDLEYIDGKSLGAQEAAPIPEYLSLKGGLHHAAAELWPVEWSAAPLWADPLPATSQLKLKVPSSSSSAPHDVPFEEILLEPELPSATLLGAHPGSRQHKHGRVGAPIFKPGGEEWSGTRSRQDEVKEAALSGAWLAEFEASGPHTALAPGMKATVFGSSAAEPPRSAAPALLGDPCDGVAAEAVPFVSAQQAAPAEAARMQLEMADVFSGVWMMRGETGSGDEGSREGSVAGDEPPREGIEPATEDGGVTSEAAAGSTAPGDAGELSAQRELDALLAGEAPPALGGDATRKPKPDADWAEQSSKSAQEISSEFARIKANLAMHWPFELDTFQKDAICRMEESRSVFVAAHTSAGKTVVAEYALALATKHCTRTVYTSPIKTISNQKFRDFSHKFEVGLLTGDVQIKPEAPCLIMTTEILRSMLYKGADIIRDIEWVIFDEVHYVNDAERGVVWEEVIIMLPAHVNIILLSATVPNVLEFANWVGRTKRKLIHVTGTQRRPVPLEHNLFHGGSLFPICRQDTFLPQGLKRAADSKKKLEAAPLTNKEAKAARPTGRGGGNQGRGRGSPGRAGARTPAQPGGRGGGGWKSEKSQLADLLTILKKGDLLPAVVFCFSKKRIDAAADAMHSRDLTTASEKSQIHVFFEKCVSRLRGSDASLPQVLRVREMLKRGVGVHHAGLLPIMKEIVEMLFCKGLIKVLFATETFAMGVNAPARTVVFHSTRKHDGKGFRSLLPGEYTQMAGRAGRRGLDSVGTVVIVAWDELPEELELRKMMLGRATRLESQFRLTYSMILNLLRTEDLKIEDMMKRSFAEYHSQRSVPEALAALAAIESHLERLERRPWPSCYLGCSREQVMEYVDVTEELAAVSRRLQGAVMASKAAQNALVPGRLVQLVNAAGLPEVGVICGSSDDSAASPAAPADRQYYVLRLRRRNPIDEQEEAEGARGQAKHGAASGGLPGFEGMRRAKADSKRQLTIDLPQRGEVGGVAYALEAVTARDIFGIGRDKTKIPAEQLLDGDAAVLQQSAAKLQRAQEEAAREGGSLPLLDPRANLKLNDLALAEDLKLRQELLERRDAMPCHSCPGTDEQFVVMKSIRRLQESLRAKRHAISDANLQQMPEFHQRLAILQELGYVDSDHTVQLKGRVACEINTGDELLSTEMIFGGVLTDLEPEEAVALLSALVFQEKTEVMPELTPRLLEAKQRTLEIAKMAGEVQKAHGLDTTGEEFANSTLRFGLLQVVYEWAQGTPFAEICDLTDIMEGSIVRTIVRLEEACREFRDAARVMGNMQLFRQMEQASAKIKRDVIFAASLYIA